jgi:tryptophan halogenase
VIKRLVIVGGGTAGWLSAAYLARMLGASAPDGVAITLVESPNIPILGVGEGTFPSLQRTLRHIGADEASFLRESHATFKQGIRFNGWRYEPGHAGRNHFLHPFTTALIREDLDLASYWLLGCAGPDVALDEATSVQMAVADASRGPKRIFDGEFTRSLNYAYHFDAAAFAQFLARHAVRLGVEHVQGTVEAVNLDEQGRIVSLKTERGEIAGDLFVDCTGLRARLIGEAMGAPFRSVRRWLFCDRAVAMQVPYDRPDHPIASYTISTAQEAGWTWDIGLDARKGTGYVYSSDHTDDARAEEVLRRCNGPAAADLQVRAFRFDPGYRETPWVGNCVAIGLSGAFFEPLEATGIVMIETAATLLSSLFPWDGRLETSARQFNRIMTARSEQVLDFLKAHYWLSERRDTAFWRDNTVAGGIPDSLKELLDRWRVRPPGELDFDSYVTPVYHDSWKHIIYGLGFKTDLHARAAALRNQEGAREEFAKVRAQSAELAASLPSHRDLIDEIYRSGYRRESAGMSFAIGTRYAAGATLGKG